MTGSEQPEPIPSPSTTAWLTPAVRGIGAASFLADVGHEIPTALLPGFLTSTLGAPAVALGLIEGVSDGLAGVSRLAGGALSDDPAPRRAIAVGGYTTAFGVLAAIQSLGNFAASAVAGLIWTLVSAQAAFIYLAIWMGLALVLLLSTGSSGSKKHRTYER